MFAGQTRALPYIRNWAEADAYFNKTKKPPRSKKWAEYQRPLKNASSWHYRIEKHGDMYDLCLYHTVMARYHKPTEGGSELRQYMGHDSQTSKGYMWDVLGVSYFSKKCTTDGRVVFMPIPTVALPGSEFSCHAWFNANGDLLVDSSEHTPLFKRVSGDDDKHMRKVIKAKFDPLLTLCAMRIPEFENTLQADFMRGGDFVSAGLRSKHQVAIAELVRSMELNNDLHPPSLELFMECAAIHYVKLVSDRAVAQNLINWHNSTCSPLAVEQRVTEKDLVRSLWGAVLKHRHLKQQSGRVEYPQFPEPDQVTLSNVFAQRK